MTDKTELSPGEARNRQRLRRQIAFLCFAGINGVIIGFSVGFFDQGDGNLFAGDWEDLKLSAGISITLAFGLLIGFVAMPIFGFVQIDEHKRQQNLIAYTGGCTAALAGFPVWAVLYAGGFGSPPHAFGMFLITLAGMVASYTYALLRH